MNLSEPPNIIKVYKWFWYVSIEKHYVTLAHIRDPWIENTSRQSCNVALSFVVNQTIDENAKGYMSVYVYTYIPSLE